MIIWGGRGNESGFLNSGGRYNLGNDSWKPTDIPEARRDFTAVWTGTELIIWGGRANIGGVLNEGGRYDPVNRTWNVTDDLGQNVPEHRREHSAVWTGTEMIIWGGEGSTTSF